jgi:hypothetical protein
VNRHALIIGSQIEGLTGVENDTRRMRDALRRRGFEVDLRFGTTATREGILDGYDALIARTAADDAAVLYYSGHGAYAINADPTDPLRIMQAIVPTDTRSGSDTDFRGITAWELSIKLAQLTARTKNVTVFLDCCHSAQMSRGEAVRDAVARALPHPLRTGFRQHLAALERLYGKVVLYPEVPDGPDGHDEHEGHDGHDGHDGYGNPDAVRLVACRRTESSFEYTNPAGERHGVFTEALLELLHDIGDTPISWAAVGEAVRARVARRFAMQRPGVEGPVSRRLFSLALADQSGSVAITPIGERFQLQAGRITGASVGDVYGVMPPGAPAYEGARAIANVRITATAPLVSTAELAGWKNGHAALPDGANAMPIEVTAPRRPVLLVAPEPTRAALERAIAATATLRVVAAGDGRDALATLRLAGQELTIEDPAGPVFPPTRYPAELDATLKNLVNLGVAQGVRELVGEHGLSANGVAITWGVALHGKPRTMPDQGAFLGLGDRLYVSVMYTGSEPRYAHIFNVGVRGKVTLLTRSLAPTGVALDRDGQAFVLGGSNGALPGLPLHWPQGLSMESFPRTDEIFVFVTSRPLSLRSLETQEHAIRNKLDVDSGSKLQALLSQLQDGLPRSVDDPAPPEGFLVKRLAYMLHPRLAALADTVAFQIDDNPLGHAAARSPDAWITGGVVVVPPGRTPAAASPPSTISIRLGDLAIDHHGALASGDLRIDALVCTRSAGQTKGYATHTMRVVGIHGGGRIPLDPVRIFHGPVRDFVDICLWIARDTTRDRDLGELFEHHAADPHVQDAATALLATAAPWVTAVGASAALARSAYELILGVEDTAVGLYRTSFLASERFGAGRQPAEQRYRVRDLSFSFVIDEVSSTTTR